MPEPEQPLQPTTPEPVPAITAMPEPVAPAAMAPTQPAAPVAPVAAQVGPQPDQEPEDYGQDMETNAGEDDGQDPADFLTWQASEYVHHHKGMGWYVALAGLVAVLLAIAVIFKVWLSIGVFIAMGAAIAVYAHKPPRVLTYQLDSDGITIEEKLYPYENFRSFGVLSDIEWHTIDLEPTQRFMPRLTVLFGDEDFDEIVAHLERHLPRVDRDPDLVERLSRYLRF
jgi:hypothetical protein